MTEALRVLLLALAAVGAFAGSASASPTASGEAKPIVLPVTDSALIDLAWNALFPDSLPPSGEYAVLIPPAQERPGGLSGPGAVHLLLNGTEAGRMDRETWDALADQAGGGARKDWSVNPEGRGVPLLWKSGRWDAASLLGQAEWPAGFAFGIGSGISAVRSSQPQFQRDIDFAWNQKLFSHFLLGASLHRFQYGGGLDRIIREADDSAAGGPPPVSRPAFWNDGQWGWSLAAGVPGLRYTLSRADHRLPDYFWLETRTAPAIRSGSGGRLVKWGNRIRGRQEGDLSQTLDARFGPFRYSILFDFDAYRAPIQTAGCEDLPAPFGAWGAGIVIASGLVATRAWIDIPDAALTLAVPERWPTRVRVAFLHFEIAYRNQRSFRTELSVRVRVNNPVMERPRIRS